MNTLGIMFHHFHDDVHITGQGSIDANTFSNILDYLDEKYIILNADLYLEKAINNSLSQNETCLTFDDSLLCQYEIAVPILNKRKISAFFFTYSSAFTESPDYLEIFRYFRNKYFKTIEDYYQEFFDNVESAKIRDYSIHKDNFKSLDYLSGFPFYTDSEKWFRYLRDIVLINGKYEEIMFKMFNKHKFDIKSASIDLWMNENHLEEIFDQGHIVGLHSYSHPTKMNSLSYRHQKEEYTKNLLHLETILGKGNIHSMSHPCGSYNKDTIKILKELGIKIGFRSNMSNKEAISKFEIPREDHANILKDMIKNNENNTL